MWTVRFDPSVGVEMHTLRPAVVVNVPEVGRVLLRIVVPLTDWKQSYDYRAGKTAALEALFGKVMGQTRGRADPGLTRELLKKALAE